MSNSLEILNKLISFDTTCSKDTLDAALYVKDYLDKNGVKNQLVYNDKKTRASVIATIGDEREPGIIFSGHLDTVASIPEEWDTNPYTLTEKGSRVYGRGTSDMKGGIACALGNLEHFKNSGKTFHYAFTHDEEGGFEAIKQLSNNNFFGFFKHKPEGCVVMEPTLLKPVYGHKGGYFATIKVIGVESHSAYPHLGVDALSYIIRIYNRINEIFAGYKNTFAVDTDYLPSASTLNICTLKGGDACNKIAGYADLNYNIRYLPQDDLEPFIKDVKAFCNELREEIKSKSPDTDIIYIEDIDIKGFESDLESAFMKKFPNASKVSYATEAGYFQKLGINTVVFGPGSIEQAHTKNEFIEKSQLEAFDTFLKTL